VRVRGRVLALVPVLALGQGLVPGPGQGLV